MVNPAKEPPCQGCGIKAGEKTSGKPFLFCHRFVDSTSSGICSRFPTQQILRPASSGSTGTGVSESEESDGSFPARNGTVFPPEREPMEIRPEKLLWNWEDLVNSYFPVLSSLHGWIQILGFGCVSMPNRPSKKRRVGQATWLLQFMASTLPFSHGFLHGERMGPLLPHRASGFL